MVERSAMSILDVTVNLFLKRFPVVNLNGLNHKLPLNSVVGGELEARFKCVICSNIAFPINKGCIRCYTYACEPCVASILKENKECPNPVCAAKHPGKVIKLSEEMHPLDQEKYEEIRLKCTDCATVFSINDTLAHK